MIIAAGEKHPKTAMLRRISIAAVVVSASAAPTAMKMNDPGILYSPVSKRPARPRCCC